MQHQLEQLLRQRYGKKSEKLDPAQMLLFTNDTEDVPLADLPVAPEAADQPATAGTRGRKKLPPNLPREPKFHVLDEEARACPCCGKQRQEIGQETREQLDYRPASLHVVEHIRLKYACEDCQAYVATAPTLPEPIERGLPGTGLLAHVAVSKYIDHLPLYRLEGIFARDGVMLSRSTMCDWMASIAGLMEPIWKAMKARVLLSNVIQTDDTPVSVQDLLLPGKNRTGRFWVYLGDRANRFLIYDYTRDRSRDGPDSFLSVFSKGYLQSDAYSAYDSLHNRGILEVACWAHARRKFYDCRSTSPDYAHPALAWIGRLYDVEKAATAVIQKRLIEEAAQNRSSGDASL
jgi:transposase